MTNLLQQFEAKQIAAQSKIKTIPEFKSGDTVKVHVKIVEGATERVQVFEGLCIKRRNHGLGSTFAVKKISNGEMIERTFMLYSPKVVAIEVVKVGRVRRAKLYYMRQRTGKAARIKEVNKFSAKNKEVTADNTKKAESGKADSAKAAQKMDATKEA